MLFVDAHKLDWFANYENIEWECTPDSITVDILPSTSAGKTTTITLISPQAHLIDSLAGRAIYNIERAERRAARAKKTAAGAALAASHGSNKSSAIRANPALVDEQTMRKATSN